MEKMTIHYFDVFQYLYTDHYLSRNPDVAAAFQVNAFRSPEIFIKNVRPDYERAQDAYEKLSRGGIKIYPLGIFNRTLLIENKVFSEDIMAPDVELKMNFKDTDRVRFILAHSAALDADWIVVDDSKSPDDFPDGTRVVSSDGTVLFMKSNQQNMD